MDCTWITAYRTGAPDAIAAKYLARPESKTAGILACGVQGRTNLEALQVSFPLKRVYAYDHSSRSKAATSTRCQKNWMSNIIGVKEPQQAVVESDLVVTSGPILMQPTPTIQKDWLSRAGLAAQSIMTSYWTADALAQMDCISTDDHAQFEDTANRRAISRRRQCLTQTWVRCCRDKTRAPKCRRNAPWP